MSKISYLKSKMTKHGAPGFTNQSTDEKGYKVPLKFHREKRRNTKEIDV